MGGVGFRDACSEVCCRKAVSSASWILKVLETLYSSIGGVALGLGSISSEFPSFVPAVGTSIPGKPSSLKLGNYTPQVAHYSDNIFRSYRPLASR